MKKIIALVLAFVVTSAAAIGGTMAYLTSEDSDVNVMTIGKVKIEQLEYERDPSGATVSSAKYGEGYKLVPFTQNKPLFPATGAVTGWGETAVYFDQLHANKASGGQKVLDGLNNVQDKFVLVRNTGRSNAYVRTIFAFELGSISDDEWENVIMTNINDQHWVWNWLGAGEINGNNYYLVEVVYTGAEGIRHSGGILPAGEYSYSSLAQIYMTATATNEDVEAIDGNSNGTYDILVLSQAVQTEGFADAKTALDTAFGAATTATIPVWFGDTNIPVVVSTADELTAALAEGSSVILESDLALDADNTVSVAAGNKVKLDLNGHTITSEADGTGNRELFLVKGDMTVSNGTISISATQNQGWGAMSAVFDVTAGGVLNIENATIDNQGGTDMNFCVHLNNWGEVTLNVRNSTLKATYIPVRVFNSGPHMNNVTIENSTLEGKYCFWVHNYTLVDFGNDTAKQEAAAARLNLDIYGNGNTFINSGKSPVLFGFDDSLYFDAEGNEIA